MQKILFYSQYDCFTPSTLPANIGVDTFVEAHAEGAETTSAGVWAIPALVVKENDVITHCFCNLRSLGDIEAALADPVAFQAVIDAEVDAHNKAAREVADKAAAEAAAAHPPADVKPPSAP